MHKFAVLTCLAALCLSTVRADKTTGPGPTPARGGLRYTIAVTKFQNHSSYAGQFALADTFGAVLTDSLLQTERFIVIGEADMRLAALAEQESVTSRQAAGGDKAPVAGNLTPAQLLVKGEIMNFQDGTAGSTGGIGIGGLRLGAASRTAEINAVIYFVDSTTGQVKASKKVVGKIKSSSKTIGLSKGLLDGDLGSFKQTNVGKAMDAAVDQAVAFCIAQLETLPWTANVILLRDDKIYFNRGRREGVAVGQVFKVGTAEILRDPGTGEVLDNNFTETAQIRVESIKEKLAICTLIAGSGIEKGMAVSPVN